MALIHWWGAPRHIGSQTRLSSRLDELLKPELPEPEVPEPEVPEPEVPEPEVHVFEASQQMTVSLRGVMFHPPPMDKNGKNDPIIVTTNQFGTSAPMPRLHFMKDNVPLGWQGDFFDDTILAVSDLRPEWRKLTIRVQVYDLDQIPTDLFKQVGVLAATSVALAFPTLAPFALAGAAVIGPLTHLIGNLDKHDEIIDQRVALEVSDPGYGNMLLQPGYYVCFAKPVDNSRTLQINHALRVLDGVNEFTECSYAVLELEPSFTSDRVREIDQNAARLIAELDGKDASASAIEFLRSAVGAADNFRRLERAQQIIAKNPAEVTESDRKLLEALRSDPELAPFLRWPLP